MKFSEDGAQRIDDLVTTIKLLRSSFIDLDALASELKFLADHDGEVVDIRSTETLKTETITTRLLISDQMVQDRLKAYQDYYTLNVAPYLQSIDLAYVSSWQLSQERLDYVVESEARKKREQETVVSAADSGGLTLSVPDTQPQS